MVTFLKIKAILGNDDAGIANENKQWKNAEDCRIRLSYVTTVSHPCNPENINNHILQQLDHGHLPHISPCASSFPSVWRRSPAEKRPCDAVKPIHGDINVLCEQMKRRRSLLMTKYCDIGGCWAIW